MIQTRAYLSRRISYISGLVFAPDAQKLRLQAARGFWLCTVFVSGITFVVGLPHLATSLLHPDNVTRVTLAASGIGVETRGVYLLALVLLSSAISCGAAIFIALRKSNDPVALFVSWLLISVTGSLATPELHGNVFLTSAQVMREWIAWSSIPVLMLVFPDGCFRPRWGAWVAVGATIGQGLAYVGGPGVSDIVPSASALACGVVGIAGQVMRYRSASGVVRQQTRWVLSGFLIAFSGLVSTQIAQGLFGSTFRDGTVGNLILVSVLQFSVLQIPISLAVAILRYHLFDIHVFLNRSLVFMSLSGCAALLYLAVSAGTALVVPGRAGALSSIAAAAAVALLFAPMRYRLQRAINRLMYGHRDEPYVVLSTLGERLGSALAVDDVLPAIVDTVMRNLRLPYAAVSLVAHGEQVIMAARGEPLGETRTLPLLFGSEHVGILEVSPRGPNEELSPDDLALLTDLARQAGAAAHGVRLTAELRRSRERIVSGREEERRRLRRDLHDGLGPTLASITLMADAARNLLDVDSQRTREILDDLRAEAQAATGDIRRVVYELRPPSLDDVGLLGVLARVSETLGTAGIAVNVESPNPMPVLPAAVEVAAYRVIHEALVNIARHSGASRCLVHMKADTDFTVDIQDNGCGVRATPAGMGRISMRERAEELGGTCTVESVPTGGTVVHLSLPLQHEALDRP